MVRIDSIYVFVFIILIFFTNCTKNEANKKGNVIVSGVLIGSDQDRVYLSNEPIPLENEWSIAQDTTGVQTIVDNKGNFRFEIEIDKPDFYRINYQGKSVQLYLNANDSVFVTLDSLVNIKGSNADLNSYYHQQKISLDKSEKFIISNLESIYALDQNAFINRLDSLKTSNIMDHETFFRHVENAPFDFKERSLSRIENQYKYYKLMYPLGHESITGNKAVLTNDFFGVLSERLNTPQFLDDKKYVSCLDKYIEIISAGIYKYERYDNKPIEKIWARYTSIKESSLDEKIKAYLFAQHFKLCNENYSVKHWKPILDDFKEYNKNLTLYSKIDDIYKSSLENRKKPHSIKVYKSVDGIELDAHIFFPEKHNKDEKKPAYLYFHGGGWSLGMAEAGYTVCENMSKKGMIAITFEYRLIDVHGNIIQKGLEDAKSAIRWVRSQATELGIDPDKIVAAGFSAGAHLAASTAIIDDFISEDNNTFSSVPNLVITQSASYDLTKADYFVDISKGQPQSVSLLQNVKSDLPPFLLFHTTEDYLSPVYRFFEFKSIMETYQNDFQSHVFEGVGHFFRDENTRDKMNVMIDEFLEAKGFLNIDKH